MKRSGLISCKPSSPILSGLCQNTSSTPCLSIRFALTQAGTLAGNLAIKHAHPEFPSDVFIVLEALDAQVIVQQAADKQETVSLASYLAASSEGKVIRGLVLRAYPKERFAFDSYKVSVYFWIQDLI